MSSQIGLLLSLLVILDCYAFLHHAVPSSQRNQPSIRFHSTQQSEPQFTVLLPAYNESLRIGETLSLYRAFLQKHWEYESEILVVDDGSMDNTASVVQTLAEKLQHSVPLVRCVCLESNQGKGAALARGIRNISNNNHPNPNDNNRLVLIADADASADIECLKDLFDSLQDLASGDWSLPALVVGRRTYQDGGDLSPKRLVLRWGFRAAVRVLVGDLGVSDTQCGFKLLTLTAAQKLYSNLHLMGWSHDVEVLYRAKEGGIPVAERDVRWEDKDGSKLVTSAGGTVGASMKMLVEIAQLRILYQTGIWKARED